MTPEEKEEHRKFLATTIDLAVKVKKTLLSRNRTSGWTKCPVCGGRVRAALVGRKNHLRMACETPNCVRMME